MDHVPLRKPCGCLSSSALGVAWRSKDVDSKRYRKMLGLLSQRLHFRNLSKAGHRTGILADAPHIATRK